MAEVCRDGLHQKLQERTVGLMLYSVTLTSFIISHKNYKACGNMLHAIFRPTFSGTPAGKFKRFLMCMHSTGFTVLPAYVFTGETTKRCALVGLQRRDGRLVACGGSLLKMQLFRFSFFFFLFFLLPRYFSRLSSYFCPWNLHRIV